MAKINLSEKEGVMIIKLASKIIRALEEDLKEETRNKTLRKSEDVEEGFDERDFDDKSTDGYVNASGGYE
tara:strand:- start:19959 stop:20168 length:210 start_codon:yes stop_codon:yes gene_type:complete